MTQRIYMRVSTDNQSQDRQKYLLEQAGYNEDNSIFYQESISGKTRKRPQLEKLLEELTVGDKLIVADLTRLARSVKDLLAISEEIIEKKANLVSLKENIDLETSTGRLLFTVISAISEFERSTLSDRTKEALKAKKQKGIKLGRPVTIDESVVDNAIETYMNGKESMLNVSKQYGISVATLCNQLQKKRLKR